MLMVLKGSQVKIPIVWLLVGEERRGLSVLLKMGGADGVGKTLSNPKYLDLD